MAGRGEGGGTFGFGGAYPKASQPQAPTKQNPRPFVGIEGLGFRVYGLGLGLRFRV